MAKDAELRLKKYLENKQPRKSRFAGMLKKTALVTAAAATLAGVGVGILGQDYMTKREAYPVRNVVYQVQETVHFAGGERGYDSKLADHKSDSVFERGSGENTKFGDVIGEYHYDRSDQMLQYSLLDKNKNRIAFASEKREPVQGGMRVAGSIDFREQQAEVLGMKGRFITYSFIPERGLRNVQLNMLEDEQGALKLVNELVTNRHVGLGWYAGERYRESAELNDFARTQENAHLQQELAAAIAQFASGKQAASSAQREQAVRRMLEIETQMQKTPVLVSHEDGYFAWLPQESSTYLFSNPDLKERLQHPGVSTPSRTGVAVYPTEKDWKELPEERVRSGGYTKLRVENQWDLLPGNIPALNKVTFGTAPNIVRPFAHVNNGGYTIKDGYGTIAQVEIEDFFLHFGDDVVYHYYLDKDGNGKIDKAKERIGSVLYRTSNDERADLEKVIGAKEEKRDVSKRFTYTFMAGSDWDKRMADFYLCNTIESFMVNEINRGFGKHSALGYINTQRSNAMLLENRTLPNLGRAITPESSIVAKYDIVNLLRAAGRDYVNGFIESK